MDVFFFLDLILSFHFYFHSRHGSSVFILLCAPNTINRGVLGVWMISHYIRYKKTEEIRATTISNTLYHIEVLLLFITHRLFLSLVTPGALNQTLKLSEAKGCDPICSRSH